MKNNVIILSGTRVAGKTYISQYLKDRNNFKLPSSITTRAKRPDDSNQYEYFTKKEFTKNKNDLIVSCEYSGNNYGIKYEEVKKICRDGYIPILVIAPQCIHQLNERKIKNEFSFISFFIDSHDNILDTRLEGRNKKVSKNDRKQRFEDRSYVKNYCFSIMNNNLNLDVIEDFILFELHYWGVGGVLPKKSILLHIKLNKLIVNGTKENVKSSSYDLSIGDEYYHNGKQKELDMKNPFISLGGGDFIIVQSHEHIKLPKNVSARFDLRVSYFCKGLILSNSTQVDPGFAGNLYCLLFNASSESIEIKRGEPFATIEFNKLLSVSTTYNGKYQNKEHLGEYLSKNLNSSAIMSNTDKINKLLKQNIIEKYLPLVIAIAALVVAIVSL